MKISKSLCLRKTILVISLLASSWAQADVNVNLVSCSYFSSDQGWQLASVITGDQPVDYKTNEQRMIYGAWTSEKPVGPEYAVCSMGVSLQDDESLKVTSYTFQAKVFAPIESPSCEDIKGTDIQLLSQQSQSVRRGEFAEVISNWMPGIADKMAVLFYMPTLQEQEGLPYNGFDLCTRITPTN